MHKIFQGYYDEYSRKQIGPAVVPVDIRFNVNHPLCEYNIYKTLLNNGTMDPDSGPVGLVSMKFKLKCAVDIETFSDYCELAFSKGADVVFINPMIAGQALYKNVWEQGEHVGHENIYGMYVSIFTEQEVQRMTWMSKSTFAFCNYFVGNAKFWKRYIEFCDRMLLNLEGLRHILPPLYEIVYKSANYQRKLEKDYRPFVIERLFSSFLILNPDIIAANYEQGLDVYVKKFGSHNGRFLYHLSEIKNKGIYSRDEASLKQWLLQRKTDHEAMTRIWQQDDPEVQPYPMPSSEALKDLPESMAKGMNVFIEGLESVLKQTDVPGDFEVVLEKIFNTAYQLSDTSPQLEGRALFISQLDDYLTRAAAVFLREAREHADPKTILHIATEIYETGGHTRVIEDIIRTLPEYKHIVILTDINKKYQEGGLTLDLLKKRFDHMNARIVCLQDGILIQKIEQLIEQISHFAPQTVFMHVHHYDVVANVAITGQSAPRVLYLHHCDHNPALGATRSDYLHVDLSPAAHEVCKTAFASPPAYLGLCVEDKGVIQSSDSHALIGATCGSPHKYEGRCEFSYAELLASLFAGGVTKMFHIGDMPETQKEQIKIDIRNLGQDAEPLIFLPNTPSLTASLKELAPTFFLCSYPQGGGKTMLEAMSTGLPLLMPCAPTMQPLLCVDLSLGIGLKIETLEDVSGTLEILRTKQRELGQKHREVFEQHYSIENFRPRLLELIQID
jgi:hypothetical protein